MITNTIDIERIHSLLDDEASAWTNGDADGFSRHFAANGTFTNIIGMFAVGHDAFLERHRLMLNGIFRKTVLNQRITSLQFLSPAIAVVETLIEVTGCSVDKFPGVYINEQGVLKTRLLQVLKKDTDGWKIVAYHNVDIKQGVPVAQSVSKD